ncbi:MAG: glycosyltransferase family 4 protein [Pelatocladus maniniholoensis HA4357-MV3]|jgi:glycogen(starch) synthase|uniref:Glycosyltransferase family 4 protein n=1 Tax=Pelatocladus maniniholoensis HA4357-MV3 TaxID=1117104 RepID=A0A9E3LSM9_9NOST|nr:glycosyltransferase family 4 protein [Pelatocladus maniniholoensis HA4357-MV3]BAZ68253.1 group 1 glycosyl transferase [Fischerella sp. NIES-4106]
MNILIYSPVFYPSIGGLETVVSILAHEFFSQGHEVKLVSQTPATDSKIFPFEVIRQPHPNQLLNLTHWCDIYFQPNISLKGIWPLLISPKPWVVAHNGWYTRTDDSLGWQDYLKHFAIRFATGISVSQAVANHVSTPSTVIPNPYREDIFYEIPEIPRDKELVFLGRLVSDKGADLLLDALANLKTLGITPKLTIIGSGPEESKLRQQVKDLELLHQVDFVGVKVEHELAKLLNAHQILVVPSRWQEPFGVVALEGIACGCVVIGSEGGGLKEAIGFCGVTFPNGDVQALTQVLSNLLTDTSKLFQYREKAASHLCRHRQADVAKAYLQVFEQAIQPTSLVK